eukprot:7946203-Alexandrium_andersonii.AAC.1
MARGGNWKQHRRPLVDSRRYGLPIPLRAALGNGSEVRACADLARGGGASLLAGSCAGGGVGRGGMG